MPLSAHGGLVFQSPPFTQELVYNKTAGIYVPEPEGSTKTTSSGSKKEGGGGRDAGERKDCCETELNLSLHQ